MYRLNEWEACEEFSQIQNLLNTKEVLNLEEYERVVGWDISYEKLLHPIGNTEFLNLVVTPVEVIVQIFN